MTGDFLRNFEVVKLIVSSPDIVNTALLLVLCAASLLSIKRMSSPTDCAFLSPVQTDQMKGAAILLVIVGHLWFHVAKPRAAVILSGDALAFFFLLSGFGLTIAAAAKPLSRVYFWRRRVQRVMIPYWCATVLILVADYLLLDRTYDPGMIILTLLGINVTDTATHLDYVRWYITLQLVWYGLFFCFFARLRSSRACLLLCACAAIIFFVDYYILRQGWSQIFAFPAGCACGLVYPRLRDAFNRMPRVVPVAAVLAIVWVLLYKALIEQRIEPVIPQIFCKLIREANGMLCTFGVCALIALLGSRGLASRFLLLCGGLSYELFLLHGPLLIKYNPVLRSAGTIPLIVQCLLFFCLLLALSWCFRTLILLMRTALPADRMTR